MAKSKNTRENWLENFTELARPAFKKAGYEIPKNIRMSIGFTSQGKRGNRSGECWNYTVSNDETFEIFIKPTMDDSERIAGILTHELIHATIGIAAGHSRPFVACARAMGLEGKPTVTTEGDKFREWATPILNKLGDIPHAEMKTGISTIKKTATRMLKKECNECGFIFRTTAKWEDAAPVMRCPDPHCLGEME